MLSRFKSGEIGTEELSRYTAALVFGNILRNPGKLKFNDYIKLVKLKIMKEQKAVRLINNWR